MTLKIKTAPRLGDSTDALDVFVEWIARAVAVSVTNPRTGDRQPHREIQIPEAEFRALRLYIDEPNDNDPTVGDLAKRLGERLIEAAQSEPETEATEPAEDPPA